MAFVTNASANMAKMHALCRVCGSEFTSRRFDSVTCTSTCRQRLWRGYAFAYLSGMTDQQQQAEREKHERIDLYIASKKRLNRSVEIDRILRRSKRRAKRIAQAIMSGPLPHTK
jgi:hypothetical protein